MFHFILLTKSKNTYKKSERNKILILFLSLFYMIEFIKTMSFIEPHPLVSQV